MILICETCGKEVYTFGKNFISVKCVNNEHYFTLSPVYFLKTLELIRKENNE